MSSEKRPFRDSALLQTAAEVLPVFAQITALADANRDELGFLPYSALEELALKSQMWAMTARDGTDVLAFISFGESRSTIRIFQLLVDPRFRGQGIASSLLAELERHGVSRGVQVISARVASELPANRFWEKCGYRVIRQVPGGKTTGRTINIRANELPGSSLILAPASVPTTKQWLNTNAPAPLLSAPTYALDLNIVFDALRDRPGTEFAQQIFAAAFSADIRLCVSHEFAAELQRRSRAPNADPLLRLALSLPTLPEVDDSEVEELLTELRTTVFPDRSAQRREAQNDHSDLRHLASCIFHGVHGFLTRDRAILGAASILHEKFSLEVVAPLDLLNSNVSLQAQELPRIIQTPEVTLRVSDFQNEVTSELKDLFARLDVPASSIRILADPGTSTRPRHRIFLITNETIIGFASWNDVVISNGNQQCYLVLDESKHGFQMAIDHVLGSILGSTPGRTFTPCDLWTSASQIATRATGRALGFDRFLDSVSPLVGLRKVTYRGWVAPAEWPGFSEKFRRAFQARLTDRMPTYTEATTTGILLNTSEVSYRRAIDLFDFETFFGPCLLLAPGRKSFLVPIRDKQASELLPMGSRQHSLFSKEAVVHAERAYFLRPAGVRAISRGALVIFYVSGAEGGRAEAIGIARVTSTGVDSPSQLQLRLMRQGVLSAGDLAQLAGRSLKIGYFTFDSFLHFGVPISFGQLRKLGCVGPANLVTVQKLAFEKLLCLCEYAVCT